MRHSYIGKNPGGIAHNGTWPLNIVSLPLSSVQCTPNYCTIVLLSGLLTQETQRAKHTIYCTEHNNTHANCIFTTSVGIAELHMFNQLYCTGGKVHVVSYLNGNIDPDTLNILQYICCFIMALGYSGTCITL